MKRKEFTEFFLLKVKPVLILVFIAGQRLSLRGQSHEILYFLTSTNINLYFFFFVAAESFHIYKFFCLS